MSAPTIRRAGPDDVGAIVDLLRRSLGAHWSATLYRWKHEAGPFGPSPAWVAEADGALVALRVFLRWTWRLGERRVVAFRAVDTAVDPGWRRRGLFSRLTGEALAELAAEGGRFVFNTPNRRSLPGYLALGWRRAGRVPLVVRPRARLARSLATRRGAGGAIELEGRPLPPVSGSLAELADSAWYRDEPDAPRYRTALSPEYLSWRYAAIPGYDYRWLREEGGDGSAAAVILHRRRRGGLVEAKLSELLVRGGEEGWRRLGSLLGRLARGVEADYVAAAAAAGSPERRLLARAGFLPARPAAPRLVVRELAPLDGLPDPASPASWRGSLGDYEVF